MPIAEQLTLDFSVPDANSNDASCISSNVLSLDHARHVKLDKNLERAYRQISDSVKHVKLRRNENHDVEVLRFFR